MFTYRKIKKIKILDSILQVMFYEMFQMKMNCSACIQNPIQFLGKFTHRLIRQKNLPTVYDDNLIGNTLQLMINIFPVEIMRHC